MKHHPMIFTLVLGLAGSAAIAQAPTAGQDRARSVAQQAVSDDARSFLLQATGLGRTELQAAQLALERAHSPQVRSFARRMIESHTPLQDRLRSLAAERGVRLPAEPSAIQQDKLRLLRAADGAAFDRQFMNDFGLQAHRGALRIWRTAAAQVDDDELRAFVRQTLPTLEQHLLLAEAVAGRLVPGV